MTNNTLFPMPSLDEFDFSLKFKNMGRTRSQKLYDCIISIRVAGKKRKYNGCDIYYSPVNSFFKQVWEYKTISIGISKIKKNSGFVLAAYDQKVENGAVPVTKYKAPEGSRNEGRIQINNMAMVEKVFQGFGVEIPDVPDTQVKLMVSHEPVDAAKKIYRLQLREKIVIDSDGEMQRKEYDDDGRPVRSETKPISKRF